MTAKEYLKQVRIMDQRLKLEREKLDRLRSAVEYRSPGFEGGGGGSDKSEAFNKLIELTERYDRMAADYIDFYNAAEQKMISVEDPTLREILERRYLLYQKWEQIAEDMNYTVRHITRLHGQALQKMSLNVHKES